MDAENLFPSIEPAHMTEVVIAIVWKYLGGKRATTLSFLIRLVVRNQVLQHEDDQVLAALEPLLDDSDPNYDE